MEKRQLRPPSAQIFKAFYAIGLGPLVGRLVLLLTTTGRKIRPAAGDCTAI